MTTTIIQNQESMTTILHQTILHSWQRVVTGLMILLLSTFALDSIAQCGNSALVCNNLVRVSLDTSCTALITPDVILKDINIDNSLYRVEVRDPKGKLIPGALLTQDYDGAKLEVRVYCKNNNLYCWGSIIVEDKIKPVIVVTPKDTSLSCIVMPFELDPTALITSISFTDSGCEKPDTFSITEFQETVFPCKDTVKIIKRIFTVFDAAGNRCDTTQTIYLLKGKLSDIIFPKDTLIDCLDEADLSPAKLGVPQTGICDHFEVTKQDIEIPVCGVARKILRRWRVFDLCKSKDTTVTQVIKIEDNHAPTFNFDNFDIPINLVETDKFNCTASVKGINNPQVTDCNLAQTILTIFYQLTDGSGKLVGQLFQASVNDMLSDPNNSMTATMIWDLIDVPVGVDFKVIFVADDGCGNIARDTSKIFKLPDTSPPNAVCEGNTTVVLNNSGVTEVWADSFDDNSFDNCGIVDKKVRRFKTSCTGQASDLQFGDSVHFCCDDVANNPIKVVFRVFDASGGFSDCIVNVHVQDKRKITITCGKNLEFNCGTSLQTITQAVNNNPPTVKWVCGKKSLTPKIPAYQEDACGGAFFIVTWVAMDFNGQMDSCRQSVTIRNLVEATVTRPNLNISLTSCANGIHPNDIPNSRPIVNNVDCENIATTWEDEILAGTGNSCIKIIRSWAVIDWCKFDGGFISSGIIDKFDQTILISDNTRPIIANCGDGTITVNVNDSDESCDEQITVSIQASDDCTPSDEIIYTYKIDLNNDGSFGPTLNGSSVTNVFPVGSHSVIFTATDKCGNTATCIYEVKVTTDKAPSVLCVGLTEAVIGIDGTKTITAKSLNVKSTRGCTNSETGLIFSFNQDGTQPDITFRCGVDIPNGILNEVTLDVYVIDTASGASAICPVIISISDRQNNQCVDNIISSSLSGYITDEEISAVSEVPVIAKSMSTGISYTTKTDKNGFYNFKDLAGSDDYEVSPKLDGHPLAGVSTLDLVIIQQHVLGLRRLTSPYKLLAADVNNSNSISSLDLVILRQLILGLKSDIPNKNWKFVDRKFVFDMQNNPWNYQDHIMVNDAQSLNPDNDFIGLKVGDVNGNAFIALAQELSGPRSVSKINVQPSRSGNIVRYSFKSEDLKNVIGLQLAIDLSDDMELGVIGSDRIQLGAQHFSLIDNILRISWSSIEPVALNGEEIFFIDIRVKGDRIPELELDQSLVPEIYEGDLNGSGIVLQHLESEFTAGLSLKQNKPNPFSATTNISFQLPSNDNVDFSITDLNGKVIYKTTNLYYKGMNTITVTAGDLGQSGVYYYTVTTSSYKETKRMIVLH